jgi:hypothetical protein
MATYDGRIIAYLASGTAASRPSAPNIDPAACGFYVATDTAVVSAFTVADGWQDIGGGGGAVLSLNGLTGAVSITSPDGSLLVGTSGSDVTVELPSAPTCNETQVGASASAVELLALNANRVSATLYNASGQTLYIGSDNTVTAGTYLWNVPPGNNWTLPIKYTGALYGIWDPGASGQANIGEFVT